MFTITAATIPTVTGNLTYWLHCPARSAVGRGSILLLTFCSTRQAAFYEDPYDIPARCFAEAGHAVVSFDLPNHGEQINHFGEGIAGFCAAFCAGADPFLQFAEQGRAVIDACLAQGVGTAGIVVCGLSRAGYCALRLAAADQRVRAVAGLAPVIDWRQLREFAEVREQPAVAALTLEHWAEALAGRAVFLTIGNGDSRVSSASCAHFAWRLLALEAALQIKSSRLQLHIVDAPDHALPDHWRAAGATFLLACSQ